MKKILLILFLLLFTCNSVYAGVTKILYKTPVDNKSLVTQVKIFLDKNHYKVEMPSCSENKTNFYIKDLNSSSSECVLISVSSNGKGSYIYYFSNGTYLNFKDSLSQELKNSQIKLEKINAKELINSFTEDALLVKQSFDTKDLYKPKKNNYDFSDEAQQQYDAQKEAQAPPPVSNSDLINKPKSKKQKNFISTESKSINQSISTYIAPAKGLKGGIVILPSGTIFDASLQSTVDSASLEKDDKITATLDSDFVCKGLLVAPAGSVLYGKAIHVSHPTYASGNGDIELIFNQILTPNGSRIDISSDKISLGAKNNRAANISKNLLKGAGVGALVGLISSAISGNSSSIWRGAAIGAVCSGVAHKGENVTIQPGTPLQIKLNQPVNTSPYN